MAYFMGVIVKNNMHLLSMCVVFITAMWPITSAAVSVKSVHYYPLRVAGMLDEGVNQLYRLYGYSEKEKLIAHRILTQLQTQEKTQKAVYEKAIQSVRSDEEKAQLRNEYEKQVKDLFDRMTRQKIILGLVEDPHATFFWNTAKAFGATALIGFLVYKALVTPQLPQQKPIITVSKEIMQPPIIPDVSKKMQPLMPKDTERMSGTPDDDSAQLLLENDGVVSLPIVSDSNMGITTKDTKDVAKKILTQKEIDLYTLRFKNLRTAAAWTFLSNTARLLLMGPIGLPIDAISLSIAALSGVGALYYKEQLDTTQELPRPTILDYVLPH